MNTNFNNYANNNRCQDNELNKYNKIHFFLRRS